MPVEITFDILPAGYALSSGRTGETVTVATREFVSSEDGADFISRLEGLPSVILEKVPLNQRPFPSQIDHMLAIIRKDKTALIYLNELKIMSEVLVKRDIQANEPVHKSDIADIRTIKFEGIEIPPDAGVIYLFSVGWSKGLFYDVTPILPSATGPRDYDLGALLGQFHLRLMFQNMLKISGDAWSQMFSQGWFPFISLSTDLLHELVSHASNGWDINELLPKIAEEVRGSLGKWQTKWSKKTLFAEHIKVLQAAADRFCESDHVSAVSILYPRIEGIMRSYHLTVRPMVSQSQPNLIESALSSTNRPNNPKILLLPERFRSYLSDVYFAAFDPNKPQGISRHTVSHGVAPQDAFSLKASAIGFLILDQLSFYFSD